MKHEKIILVIIVIVLVYSIKVINDFNIKQAIQWQNEIIQIEDS